MPTSKEDKREFPEPYYTIHEQGISRQQVDEVMEKHYKYMLRKIRDGVAYKLRKSLTENESMDVVNEALLSTFKSYEKNPAKFTSQRDFFAYWLLSAWREYSKKKMKLTQKKKDDDNNEYRESLFVPLELIQDYLQAEPALEEKAIPAITEFFDSEAFRAHVHERVYDYLDNCFLKKLFTLREITIFKIFCLNDYTIPDMVKETNFSRTSITTALSKVRKHLATVDFEWDKISIHTDSQ